MLLGQNFCGRHHGGLVAVLHCHISGGRSYHGLAATYITLHQSVHRRAFVKVGGNLHDCSALGAGKLERKGSIECCQISVCINRSGFGGTGCPHQGKAGGENKELLEDQPLFGKFCLFHGGRLVDGVVGALCG